MSVAWDEARDPLARTHPLRERRTRPLRLVRKRRPTRAATVVIPGDARWLESSAGAGAFALIFGVAVRL
ncbi:MAG: hypothetical protein FJ033_10105 [Chloroflexi bacterium]|nr:hypothetical protein [Chloroflexota bacterium]